MLNNKSLFISLILVLSVIVFVPPVSSTDWSENLTINGFGHQSFIKTDSNSYLVSNSTKGSFNDYVFGITFTAKVSDEVSIKSQVLNTENGIQLDWGFGEYHFNDNVGVKAGKVKLPIGLYNETQDVKALQPFSYLPSNYNHGVNQYNGIGFFGDFEYDNDWGTNFEVSGGSAIIENGPGIEDDIELNDFIVFNFGVSTPLSGTKFNYTYGQMHAALLAPGMNNTIKFHNVSGVWDGNKMFIHSEYQYRNYPHEFIPEESKMYIETGYMVYPNIQPVFRYSYSKSSNIPGFALATMETIHQTDDQTEIGFGLNYFLGNALVVKAEHHIIDGSKDVVVDLANSINTAPSNDWSITAFSIAFTF